MEWIIESGLSLVIFLQSLGAWLVQPMAFLSFLGTEWFFLLVAPAFFWCINPAWGLRAGIALTLSMSFNTIFKLIIQGPRPYWISDRVQALSAETSFGAPSGHAQNAVMVWGALAAGFNRRWVWFVATLLMFFIGVSRIYLGVHFPHDVLIGWLIGALLLILLLRVERALRPWLERSRPATLLAASFGLSLGIILVGIGLQWAARDWALPAAMSPLAARPAGADPLDPLSLSGIIASSATFFGLAAGGTLLHHSGWFDAHGTLLIRLVRYVIGLGGLLAIYLGLDLIFPEGSGLVPIVFRYLRYMLVGLWVAYLAPLLFIRLRLARNSARLIEAEARPA